MQIMRGVLVLSTVFVVLHTDPVFLDLGVPSIVGVGLAVLVSQTAVAVAVLPSLRRFLAKAPLSPP